MQRHLGLHGSPNQGWMGIRYRVSHYSVLSEDYKQAWPMIIAVLISCKWFIEIKMGCSYRARWRAGFQGKSCIVTGELLKAHLISNPLSLSSEDSASSSFMTIEPDWTNKVEERLILTTFISFVVITEINAAMIVGQACCNLHSKHCNVTQPYTLCLSSLDLVRHAIQDGTVW